MAMIVEKIENITSHAAVFEITDPMVQLHGFVAIHSTERGPSAGGTRLWPFASRQEALDDVLKLSQGMSYKNAMADLPLGGGKAVIIKPRAGFDREALFEAYGRAVDTLNGIYITAEDVGVTPDDMAVIARATKHVAGLPKTGASPASGDPSPVTALGVFRGIQACAARQFGSSDLTGRHVAVQGVGHVGAYVCQHLHDAGAQLTVTDVDDAALDAVVARFGANRVAPEEIIDVDADIFCPCALGGVLNRDTVSRLRAKVVAGGANNQLASPEIGDLLVQHGILYAPDYVINGGGIINVAAELAGHDDRAWVKAKLDALMANLERVLDIAHRARISTQSVADELAQARLLREAVA